MTRPAEVMTMPEPPPGNLWAELRGALRGVQHDYTSGPVGRAVLLLAVPMVLETLAESVFAVVDVFFVSKLGAWATATVGITETILHLVYTVAMGLSIGVTAMVSRRVGEKDPDGAARAAVQAIVLGLAIAAVIGIVGGMFAPQVLGLMGADGEVVARGAGFTRVMFAGNATVLLLFLINAAFRGAGDAAIAMRVLWIANGINIVLDPALIFGWGPLPAMGITGAAVATNIGRGIAVGVQLLWLARAGGRLTVGWRHVRVIPAVMWRLIRLSATGMFQVFVAVASWIGLIRILAGFGAEVLAGYTIGIRLIIFALLPSWGVSNAAATMVGQALGAGKPERAERAVWTAAFYNMLCLGTIGVLYWLLAPQLVSFFARVNDPARAAEVATVVAWGVRCLRIVCSGFIFYAYGMVLSQSFNGAGDAWTPTYLNLLCFWGFELPGAALMAHMLGWGPNGVFIAMTLSFSLLALVSAAMFRRGRWKEKVI
ncbi:MAG: MATE family efflux transporter [Acidobacteriota bacterium]|jgi:putative MATE family efflux protein